MRGFRARQKGNETASRNTPFQLIAVEAGPLVMTRNRTNHRVISRGRRGKIGREISADQESADGR